MESKQSNHYHPQAVLFHALSHPIRLAILDVLRSGEACVCHLEAFLGKRQAYLSQQLSVLRECGLVKVRRDGWNVYYAVKDDRIYEVIDTVAEMTNTKTNALLAQPAAAKACRCPKCSGEGMISQDNQIIPQEVR